MLDPRLRQAICVPVNQFWRGGALFETIEWAGQLRDVDPLAVEDLWRECSMFIMPDV